MKTALVCVGLGSVWRGYERFAYDLFYLLRKEGLDVTLFKGGGRKEDCQIVLPHISRDGILSSIPWLQNSPHSSYYFEVLSFFIFLFPQLISGGFDLVHFTDCPLANFFYHARTKLGLNVRFKTLFTNGNPIQDGACKRVDFLHQLTPWQEKAMLGLNIPPEKVIMIPFGIHGEQFQGRADSGALRMKYGIPKDKKVILSVSAINRSHKRIDYLIGEVARLGPESFLLVAGHMEDSSLEREARQKLGNRFKFIHLPFEEVRELYPLADVFTLCSLIEGFGLALVEAMNAKIPVVVHASDHYRWMVGSDRSLVDLSVEGNLTQKIEALLSDREPSDEMIERNYENAVRRFDWKNLKTRYLDMYEYVTK